MRLKKQYIPIRESVPKIEARLLADDEIQDPRSVARVVWYDLTTNLSGARFKLPTSAKEEELDGHSCFPAISDIHSFEYSFAKNLGAKQLNVLRQETPVVIHRMGYFGSYGVREMWLISADGTIKAFSTAGQVAVIREGHSSGLNSNAGANSTIPLEAAIKRVIDFILRETPDAYLFLHHFGTEAQLGLAGAHIEIMPGYVTVQASANDLVMHEGQRPNVVALMADEMESLNDPTMSYHHAFWYSKETVDKAIYSLFADGQQIGFNNRRAMRGMIRRVLKQNPGAVLLAHRHGSPLNFDLATELKDIEIFEGMVQRNSIRHRPDGSVA